MLQLREYQERSLEALEKYLESASKLGAKKAFVLETDRPYHSVPRLPDLPYVCLRVPTGGGKTLMACHALGIAAKKFLQADRAPCLWLVPSNTIRDQTLAALRNRQHPYRQSVDVRFSGQVRVMDLAEALYIQRSSLEGETVIIVSTLAALRVEDTDGRKIYESAGALSHHFSGLKASLEAVLEKREDGTFLHSLANVLGLWRPIVIMDEAHNARTSLSFDTLARFNPSCVIEFTATPDTNHAPERGHFASNVLHHVSALELKEAEMVKLPIRLRTRGDWKEVIADAIQTRKNLEKLALEEEKQGGEYLRPIVLLQAQAKSQQRQTLTVDVLKKSLMEDFGIPEEQIAIATGEKREIDEINLFDRDCQLRFILTVEALKEGWDCSFAYVLCSVAEISSPRAVEQLLGRVLRLPGARRKGHAELNCAYANVASAKFMETAQSLRDALVENGFQKLEAQDLVSPQEQAGLPLDIGPLFAPRTLKLSGQPDFSRLTSALRDICSYNERSGELKISGVVAEAQIGSIQKCLTNRADQEALGRLLDGGNGKETHFEAKAPFKIPALSIRVDGELDIFDEGHFLDVPWDLAKCDPSLSEAEFSSASPGAVEGEIDVAESGQIVPHFVHELHEQLSLLAVESGWTTAALANWLDRQIPHPDIPQAQSSLFLHKLLTALMEKRSLTIDQLARQKFRLRNTVERKINTLRADHRQKAYQQFLFGPDKKKIEVDPKVCFRISEDYYAPNWYYEGGYQFQKHYFRRVGELKSEGEEFDCAVFLDGLSQVKYWIRNLERRESSFWLQTATDRFYPDFLALLNDGRILVVEYKGEHLWSNDDSKEKRAIGDLWTERSDKKCLFIMPQGTDWNKIKSVL